MKDFVHLSLLVEQDRMHSYHAGAAYWLPVLLMNWTGISLPVKNCLGPLRYTIRYAAAVQPSTVS
jgi:hypothetical protein